jgi:predicted secreted hydrolase
LMLYILRGASGETTGVYGTQVLASGEVRELEPGSVEATATGTWRSPHTGGVYPSGWRLRLPSGAQLEVRPLLQDQELYFPGASSSMVYWEGAVEVSGSAQGRGYVELTGYTAR